MQKILQDTRLDVELLEKGFVVIPFLNSDEVEALRHFYFENHPQQSEGMYATAHVSDIDFRIRMNDRIKDEFARAIEDTFENCNPLGGSFIAKGRGSRGTLHPHQDWNLVNEDEYRSFNIWVPLVDLNENNGAIKILPESHAWLKTYRSLNIPPVYASVNELLWEKMETLYMKAGEALIYDHRLLHASGENNTEELRLAAVYGIIPKDAQMYYYHKVDDGTVEEFESSPAYFLFGNTFEGPKDLKSVRQFAHNFTHDPQKLAALVKGEPIPVSAETSTFWFKFKSLFTQKS